MFRITYYNIRVAIYNSEDTQRKTEIMKRKHLLHLGLMVTFYNTGVHFRWWI